MATPRPKPPALGDAEGRAAPSAWAEAGRARGSLAVSRPIAITAGPKATGILHVQSIVAPTVAAASSAAAGTTTARRARHCRRVARTARANGATASASPGRARSASAWRKSECALPVTVAASGCAFQ